MHRVLYLFIFCILTLFLYIYMQLPIPPGLSVYGEPDETTSNIYESIDLQREYSCIHQSLSKLRGYARSLTFQLLPGLLSNPVVVVVFVAPFSFSVSSSFTPRASFLRRCNRMTHYVFTYVYVRHWRCCCCCSCCTSLDVGHYTNVPLDRHEKANHVSITGSRVFVCAGRHLCRSPSVCC